MRRKNKRKDLVQYKLAPLKALDQVSRRQPCQQVVRLSVSPFLLPFTYQFFTSLSFPLSTPHPLCIEATHIKFQYNKMMPWLCTHYRFRGAVKSNVQEPTFFEVWQNMSVYFG